MTEQEKAASPEFMYLPLENIIVEEQIRSYGIYQRPGCLRACPCNTQGQ